MNKLQEFINEGRISHGLVKLDESVESLNEKKVNPFLELEIIDTLDNKMKLSVSFENGSNTGNIQYTLTNGKSRAPLSITNLQLEGLPEGTIDDDTPKDAVEWILDVFKDARQYKVKVLEDNSAKISENLDLNESKSKFKIGDKVKYPKSKMVAIVDKIKKGPETIIQFTWEDGKKGEDGESSLILAESAQLNEGMEEDISKFTNVRVDAIKKFIDKFDLDIKKIHSSVKNGKLSDRLDFMKAMLSSQSEGSEGIYAQKYIKGLNESKVDNTNKIINETFYSLEGIDLNETELSPLQKEYQQYFKDTLTEFEVESPAKLSPEKKIEFFNAIKAGWVVGKGKR